MDQERKQYVQEELRAAWPFALRSGGAIGAATGAIGSSLILLKSAEPCPLPFLVIIGAGLVLGVLGTALQLAAIWDFSRDDPLWKNPDGSLRYVWKRDN